MLYIIRNRYEDGIKLNALYKGTTIHSNTESAVSMIKPCSRKKKKNKQKKVKINTVRRRWKIFSFVSIKYACAGVSRQRAHHLEKHYQRSTIVNKLLGTRERGTSPDEYFRQVSPVYFHTYFLNERRSLLHRTRMADERVLPAIRK